MRYERWAEKHLTGRKSGEEFDFVCPFHDDHSPSARFNLRSGLWICHACGERGSYGRLVARLGGTTLLPVEDELRGIEDEIEALFTDEVTPTMEEWHLTLFDGDTSYWTEVRGLSDSTVALFRLGYDPVTNEATIPFCTSSGALLGVVRRRLDPDARPRYSYPKGVRIGDHLFGLWLVSGRTVWLTEGAIDAMALWDVGVEAVAMGGSRLSSVQAQLLKASGVVQVVQVPDNDEVGRQSVVTVSAVLGEHGLFHEVRKLPDGVKDPAEMDREQRLVWLETSGGEKVPQ